MALVLVTPPTAEPLTLEEAKAHLRVDFPDDDALISSLITTARQYAENFLWRSLLPQTWKLTLDAFPDEGEIVLPRPPLRTVVEVRYYDENGALQSLDPSLYHVDTAREPGRIVLADGQEWPATQSRPNAVEVEYTAGYNDAVSVPAGIKQAILLLVGHWYEHREAVTMDGQPVELPLAVDSLLRQHRVWGFV